MNTKLIFKGAPEMRGTESIIRSIIGPDGERGKKFRNFNFGKLPDAVAPPIPLPPQRDSIDKKRSAKEENEVRL